MSGGVDSAVALLRAGPGAIGVTLRLWLDPRGARRRARVLLARGGDRRARDVPRPRPAARHARPARGVPARGRRRRSSRGYARGETPNPCIALQRRLPLRRAARVRPARRRRAARDRPLRARRRAPRPAAARPRRRPGEGPVVHARAPRPARCSTRIWFPLGEQTKDDDARARRRAPGSPPRGRAESQEACFLAGDDYRALPRAARARCRTTGAIVDEDGRELGRHDGFWRFTPGQRRGLGVAAPEPLYALAHATPRTNTVVVGPRAALARTRVTARGRLHVDVRRASTRSSATARPRSRPTVEPTAPRLPPRARRAGIRRRAPGRPPFSTKATPSSAPDWSRAVAD